MIYEDEFYEKKKFTKKAQNTYLLSFFLFNGFNVFFFFTQIYQRTSYLFYSKDVVNRNNLIIFI